MSEGFDYISTLPEAEEKSEIPQEVAEISELSENPILMIAQALAESILEMSKNDKDVLLTKKSVEDFVRSHLDSKIQKGRPDDILDPFETDGSSDIDTKDLEMLLNRTIHELGLKGLHVTG